MSDDEEYTIRIDGPITKGVLRFGRFNWHVGYAGQAGAAPVKISPSGKRHWFRGIAERQFRRGRF